MCNKYEILKQLSKDPRTPMKALLKLGSLEEIIQVIEDTDCVHYRVLGYTPPSELVETRVGAFYEALVNAKLAASVVLDEDSGRVVGVEGLSREAEELSFPVPRYGQHWRAWNPEIMEHLDFD